ncbi:ATP-binding protein [Marivita sp. S0852]|uniref:ATP-binding protein n=1 Tax=Marivita sp. S0852 TaxID=3373893 RepID=UPI003981B95E
MQVLPRSVRGRLWLALAVLSLAVSAISALTWTTLQKVDARLQDLHRQSLSQVAQAIDLSKRTSDLASSAPYLLNQRSNVLIEQEGQQLVAILQRVRDEWPFSEISDSKRNQIFPITQELETGITDLVSASKSLDDIQATIRQRTAELSSLRERATAAIENPSSDDADRLIWWTLKTMTSDALNGAYAENLIGVGEEQRHYQRQRLIVSQAELSEAQSQFLAVLARQVLGSDGIFELRRIELGTVLDAQNALFRIRHDANRINELATEFASDAEVFLSAERDASSSTIQLTRLSVATISLTALACALAAALFVSRYVAFNISRVSEAMVRLANGDRSSALPRRLGGNDEIGDLFRSFRSFRANALRLDRSHRQLNQRNALFEKVFANISEGIAITDATGRLTAANPAIADMLDINVDTLNSTRLIDCFRSGSFGASTRDARLDSTHRGLKELVSEDGQILEVRASTLPDDGRVWLVADVTERRNIAARLEQIDKIETLGKLAGDTAHDFGNILSTIRTHAYLLKDTSPASDHINAIENAVEYGSSLTERLLAFARKQPLLPEVLDVNALVAGMIELLEIGLKDNVALRVFYHDAPLKVLADPGQLESAILNLVLNANNAIDDQGTIEIRLSCVDGVHAEIAIIDDGAGMPAQIRQKAIEPFFTTRLAQGGTGLGLSIVYGFFTQTGGSLHIESSRGHGTTVRGILPVHSSQVTVLSSQDRRALVVDDNPADRLATQSVLGALGYDTTCCASFEAGMSAYDADTFKLVVSDFDLGTGPTGIDLLNIVTTKEPGTRCFLVSGKALANAQLPPGVTFLEKPLSQNTLASFL